MFAKFILIPCLPVLAALGLTAPAAQSETAPTPAAEISMHDIILGRIECITWRRGMLEAKLARLNRDAAGTWSYSHEGAYRRINALPTFEQNHIRPWIDADTQDVIIATYWPEGLVDDPLSEEDDARIAAVAERCSRYTSPSFIRAPEIEGINGPPKS